MTQPSCNFIIDSCCDLPREIVDVKGVEIFEFPYIIDGEERLDDMYQTMSDKEFYGKMAQGTFPSTAQIPVPVFTEMFTRAAQSGVPTIYLSFTSGLSGSADTAAMVCESVLRDYPEAELYVVDTHLASIAEGLLVLGALDQRDKGLSAKEIAMWAEEARFFINDLFVIDSLSALEHGGRVPSSIAFAGSKLDVKPLLDIDLEGKLAFAGAVRGRKKATRQLASLFAKRFEEGYEEHIVIIGHSDCPKDVERLRSEVQKIDENVLIIETRIGPVIGSHVGPGMLAIAFWGADMREELSVSDRIARQVRHRS